MTFNMDFFTQMNLIMLTSYLRTVKDDKNYAVRAL
jgi:hypothetical protein